MRARSVSLALAWSLMSTLVEPAAFAQSRQDPPAAHSDPTFADVLKALHSTNFRAQLDGTEEFGAWQRASNLPQTDAVAAIYQLWALGRTRSVELLWWQKDDRLSRVFIDMLFYCEVGTEGERMTSFPVLEPHRYASPEREQRLAEIAWVRAHRSALAKELVAIFKPVADSTLSYRRYEQIARANDGGPLPTSGFESLFPQ